MKHVTSYNLFESESEPIRKVFTREQLSWLDKCTENSWKYNPSTGLVDVDGDFYCREQGLTDLKGVKFGKVRGGFNCYGNQLTTLEGAPQTVDGDFYCNDNRLTSLVGAPQSVKGNFYCDRNHLTSLVGAPQSVGWGFYCYDNELTTLEGAPKTVDGDFYCYGNQLTSLEGAPQSVKGSFVCEGNPVSESTLKAIFALMKKGKPYQQALEKRWPKMRDKDRVLMYKQMTNLPPEEMRKYNALATYANIKDYL
jgi:hypothetical protein